jgi:hypothetical protein
MSFTEDELRSFNSILEQRLTAHRREMERMLDQRIQTLRRDFDQRLISVQQEIIRILVQKLADQQGTLNEALNQKFGMQQASVTQAVGKELERKQEQQQLRLSEQVDRTLAAQLLAIEQLLNQHFSSGFDSMAISAEQAAHFEAIEVQTDLPWDDLLDIFGKALDERFADLKESLQAAIKDGEHHFSSYIHTPAAEHTPVPLQPYKDNLTTLQDVFASIEQLERIVESMQVAMTNGHALLANRLYHHQQLPSERAHPVQQPPTYPNRQPNGAGLHSLQIESNGQ